MSTKRLINKHSVLGRLGSFWGSSLDAETLARVRTLSHFVDHSSAVGDLAQTVSLMSGEDEVAFEHRTLKFETKDVVFIDELFQERIRIALGAAAGGVVVIRRPEPQELIITGWAHLLEPSYPQAAISTEAGVLLLFPTGDDNSILNLGHMRPMYALRVPFNWKFTALESISKTLVVGLDFVQQPGLLIFEEHPETLFPTRQILVRAGAEILPSPLCYSMQLDSIPGTVKDVAAYYRGLATTAAFEKAVATAAGLVVTPQKGTVNRVTRSTSGEYSYAFDWGVLHIPYEHAPLELYSVLEAGTIIGGAVRVFTGTSTYAWWRETDWSKGISMDAFCPVKGLTIPDAIVRCDAVDETADKHARLHLTGQDNDLERYWTHVKSSELLTGNYLNAVVGLADLDDVKFFNGIDFFFKHLLGDKSLVVELHTEALGGYYHQRALEFIRREKPVNLVTIINSL